MRVAHFSDTHLGFRHMPRTLDEGRNAREADVMATFRQCLEAIETVDPDLVIHSGDLFHSVRPTNITIVEAYTAISEFQRRRGGRPFVLLGGNHDTPRTSDGGSILHLFRGIPGVVELSGDAGWAEDPGLASLDCDLFAVPHHGLAQKTPIPHHPRTGRRFTILTIHGSANGLVAGHLPGAFEANDYLERGWTYIALGDYHKHSVLGPACAYPGSTDFTSSNIWEEADQPKGWILFDAHRQEIDFRTLTTRPVVSLPEIDASDGSLTPDELAHRVAIAVQPVPEGAIVRQVVINGRTELRGAISRELMRDLLTRLFHFQLDVRTPSVAANRPRLGDSAGRSLEETWEDWVMDRANEVIDAEAVCLLGRDLLQEVRAHADSASPA